MSTAAAPGLLVVRAVVAAEATDAFNEWYNSRHVPDAQRRLDGIRAVSRWESLTDHGTFTTAYSFEHEDQVLAALASPQMRDLIAEFDETWGASVQRGRSGYRRIFRAP